jgi:phage portal protein BeeE
MPTLAARIDGFLNPKSDPEAKALAINPMPRQSLDQIRASVKPIRQNPYVALALEKVTEHALSADFGIYTISDGQRTQIEDHPFADVLRDPNPNDTYLDLMGKTHQSIRAFGNAYWWLWGDARGLPGQIWHLPSTRVRIEPSETTRTARYIYEFNGVREEFSHLEIVHFKRDSLDDDFYGDSMLSAIYDYVVLDIKMAEHQIDFFANQNASPTGLLGIPQWGLTKVKQFLEEFFEKFGGGKRGTMPYELDGDGNHAVYQRTGVTQQEMEFVQSRNANRQVIVDRLGLPVATMSENVTEANARVGERFLAWNGWFQNRQVAYRINKDILWPFYGRNYFLQFEDIRRLDSEQLLKQRQASDNVLDRNEQRDYLFGREPINEETLDNATETE